MQSFNSIHYIAYVGLILLFISCKTPVNQPQQNTSTDTLTMTDKQLNPSPIDVATGNNQLAFDLLNQYKSETNIFFSPYSLSTALAMTFEGAKGQTAVQMQQTLHLPNDVLARQNGYTSLQKALNTPDSSFKLSIANALWLQKDYAFLPAFTSTAQTVYEANNVTLDYKNEAEKARLTINDWVEKKTENKIKDLIPQGAIDATTRLVLTNAIYFKGNWATAFEKKLTFDETFKTANGTAQKVPMMRFAKAIKLSYLETDSAQILELPYKGNKLSMLIYLPKDNNNAALKAFNLEQLNAYKSQLNATEIMVNIPKFKLETQYNMAKDLKAMGMPLAFSDNADFSGMSNPANPSEQLKISAIIHKAFIEVNEEGTEAAAATGVIMMTKSIERPKVVPIFKADHPFIFVIQDKKSGAVLFMGRVDKI